MTLKAQNHLLDVANAEKPWGKGPTPSGGAGMHQIIILAKKQQVKKNTCEKRYFTHIANMTLFHYGPH